MLFELIPWFTSRQTGLCVGQGVNVRERNDTYWKRRVGTPTLGSRKCFRKRKHSGYGPYPTSGGCVSEPRLPVVVGERTTGKHGNDDDATSDGCDAVREPEPCYSGWPEREPSNG